MEVNFQKISLNIEYLQIYPVKENMKQCSKVDEILSFVCINRDLKFDVNDFVLKVES